MNEIVPLKRNQELDEVISFDNKMPFYIAAKEGLFLHRTLSLGLALIKAPAMPPNLGELGAQNGIFWWKAPIIPANLCAQIVHFFKRIYDTHKTEAEVILTFNPEKQDWRVFIPTQRVSGGAVNSVFEPSHIEKGYLVAGTMHSHCAMGAFHSNVDTGDADDMDGVHFTIGRLDRDEPEIAAMVAVNKTKFHYKDYEILADFSDLKADTSPTWWDRYVTPGNVQPVGFQNFEKYSRPAVSYENKSGQIIPYRGYSFWDDGDGYDSELWSAYYNERYGGSSSWESKHYPPKKDETDDKVIDRLLKERAKQEYTASEDAYWEDFTDGEVRDALFDSDLLTDEDIDAAIRAGRHADTEWWTMRMLEKYIAAIQVLKVFGIEVQYSLKRKVKEESNHGRHHRNRRRNHERVQDKN